MTDVVDCVIVGRKYPSIDEIVADAKTSQESSALYQHIKANTLMMGERRISYMDLLNLALERSSGKEHHLHMAELPSLGPVYLKCFLERRGLNTRLINTFNNMTDALLDILSNAPRVLAISTTFYFDSAPIRDIVRFVKENSPETFVVAGGPHVFNICSYYDHITQDFIFGDIGADAYIFDSQGEQTLAAVCEAIRDGAHLSEIPNLVFKAGLSQKLDVAPGKVGKFHRTRREIENNSMNENWVDWTMLDDRLVAPTTLMRTARSCPFRCEFCSYPHHAGKYVQADLQFVEKEMRLLKERGTKTIIFTDDTINVPLNRFKDLLRMMIDNQFNFGWFSHFRCAQTDDDVFELMKESGCVGVDMGIESGDWTILKNMNKRVSPEKYRYAIPRLKDVGIITYADLLIGFPGETHETVSNTISFMNEVRPDFYHAEVYIHLPTTPIQRRSEEYGIKGGGYSWSHDTMDWREACRQLERLYSEVTGSVVLPRQNFGSFTIPYLLSKGLPIDKYREFLKIGRQATLATMDDKPCDQDAVLGLLTELFADVSILDPSRLVEAAYVH